MENHDKTCCQHSHGEGESHEHGTNQWVKPAISAVLLIIGMVLEHSTRLFENIYIEVCYYVIAFLPVGVSVLKEAWEGISEGDVFSEFTLMSVASIGAFAIGEFPEAVAVMLLYTVGEILQDGAVDMATRNISNLIDVRPNMATVIRDGHSVEVPPAEIAVGEVIEVKTGERVSLDGKLVDARAEFDTSALTGESAPREVEQDGDVLAGMIAIGRPIKVKVTKPYEESTLARILNLVKEASDRKAPAELFIHRFARIYTPIVMALAVLIVAVPALVAPIMGFDYTFTDWLYRGLVFLVISCPCALVISVPLGYYAGIGAASKLGILFKGGNYLDALTYINSIAFDKTGTLTKGRFEVTEVVTADGFAATELLNLVMSVEAKSTHPIARAIVEYATAHEASDVVLDSLGEKAGNGMEAVYKGREVLVGNYRLLSGAGVAVPAELLKTVATVVLCAVDRKFAGAFMLADCLKEDAAQAMAELKELGLTDIHLLSGDKREIVEKYASDLGIANAHAELLPQDKANRISELVGHERRVAFVGDGMNDAPVLALSHVGIAMGGVGSDAAVESADVIIQNDMPSRVATALRIARTTRTVVRENIVGAIGVKVIILVLGAVGIASLWSAVFADVGVALLAVANSMRLLYKRY